MVGKKEAMIMLFEDEDQERGRFIRTEFFLGTSSRLKALYWLGSEEWIHFLTIRWLG